MHRLTIEDHGKVSQLLNYSLNEWRDICQWNTDPYLDAVNDFINYFATPKGMSKQIDRFLNDSYPNTLKYVYVTADEISIKKIEVTLDAK